MHDDQLEFQISQYLDGTLPAEEAAAMQARLAEDSAARGLLEEHRKLSVLLKAPAMLPDLAWDRLADHLCSAVADADRLEFAVSQYVDGTLPTGEAATIEARLEEDVAARGIADEHRKVVAVLKSAALPQVRWDRLAEHLSDKVAEASEPATIKLFAQPWMRGLVGLALAACVAIVSAVGIRGYLSHHAGTTPQVVVGPTPSPSPVVAVKPIDVQIGAPDFDASAAHTAVAAEITIGAGPDGVSDGAPAFAEGIVARSPRSLIATASPTGQDSASASMPY